MATDLRKSRRPSFCWVGQRVSDVLPSISRVHLSAIISCDYGQTGQFIEEQLGIPIFSIERQLALRKNWSSLLLDSAVKWAASESDLRTILTTEKCNLLPYATTPALELFAAAIGCRILGPSSILRNLFDDKLKAVELFRKLGLPTVPGLTVIPRNTTFERAAKYFGLPFVIRHPHGSAGSGTYLISNAFEYSHFCSDPSEPILLEQLLPGYSLNVNAVCSHAEIYVAPISVQLVGLPACSRGPFTYCGNDFASAEFLPDCTRSKCVEYTLRIGGYMRDQGYRGVFGIDFLVADNDLPVPIEINARFQNSTAIVNSFAASQGHATLTDLHVAACLGEPLRSAGTFLPTDQSIGAAQLILHNLKGVSEVRGQLLEGFYRAEEWHDEIRLHRAGIEVTGCLPGEFFIGSSVPHLGLCVEESAPLLRLQVLARALAGDLTSIDPQLANLISSIYCQLNLQKSAAIPHL